MKAEGKELNFELDLLPVISMMSVCICFLLLTAVWTQIGSINIEQGLGQEATRLDPKAPSLWITMKPGGHVNVSVMDSPSTPGEMKEKAFSLGGTLGGSTGGAKEEAKEEATESGWRLLEKHAEEIMRVTPELKTALIMPDSRVSYGEVIKMMDHLKSLQIGEIGIAPL